MQDAPKPWLHEIRWVGHGTCFCSKEKVLSYGKYSVFGSTGNYYVVGPDGWVIDKTHPFQTEQEAKDFVLSKSTP